MRGVPNPCNDQPSPPSLDAVQSGTFIPREPIPEDLATLGREVLELVPRKPQPTLAAYREAAQALSQVLKVTGARVPPKKLYYAALRVKWLADNTSV